MIVNHQGRSRINLMATNQFKEDGRVDHISRNVRTEYRELVSQPGYTAAYRSGGCHKHLKMHGASDEGEHGARIRAKRGAPA